MGILIKIHEFLTLIIIYVKILIHAALGIQAIYHLAEEWCIFCPPPSYFQTNRENQVVIKSHQ